ncbi:hypothetical protein A3862_27385 [Methylobacterium sp. XJLW]|jgi:hypothetical protein|uniref:hypothetical protein n=1 Tax=Methylobacterium sp. XJLW TaxID=739141 RepID=UPI000DAAF9C5|nr:hypothetical protein [Methylobacterium sp. XJLW]AWV18805.1 hypothetical protein A3862_27385 [Methylobacterium sp. XJLW]
MQTRFRTLLLAGAASLAVSGAIAATTINGVPATISQLVQIVWNDQNISTANPLPVNVAAGGGGSVTAAGTNGTTAQAVQGINGGVPVGVSNSSLASLDTKTPAIGTQTKAASRSVTPASDLANIEPAGTAVTGVTMPAGGTGITGWLSSIWQATVGRQTFLVSTSSNLAAGGFLNDANYVFLGASPSPYVYLNASFYSNQSGTYTVQATDGTNLYTISTGTVTASTVTNLRLQATPVTATGTRYRAYLTNGSTAATVAYASVSLSSN